MKSKYISAVIFLLLQATITFAQGDLLVTPKRVLFNGNKQRETLNLVNIGKDTAVYSITFVQKVMLEDGSFRNIEKADSGQMFANPYLVIFPRKVTLAPGEAQAVMVQCRRKPDMAQGEYRSHLFFRAEKTKAPMGIPSSGKDTNRVSVQLQPIFGVSIPIIIHSGEVNVTTSISNIKLAGLEKKKPSVRFSLVRQGNISAYGDVTVEFTPNGGKTVTAGIVKSLAVYTTINRRDIEVPLTLIDAVNLRKGILSVKFTSPEGTKQVVFARNEITLN
ncbi:MAG: hypothetical protein U0X39_07580 [Bacteroidales bacterium]